MDKKLKISEILEILKKQHSIEMNEVTFRYYQKLELLPNPEKRVNKQGKGISGYYSPAVINTIKEIIDLKNSGRELIEIKKILDNNFSKLVDDLLQNQEILPDEIEKKLSVYAYAPFDQKDNPPLSAGSLLELLDNSTATAVFLFHHFKNQEREIQKTKFSKPLEILQEVLKLELIKDAVGFQIKGLEMFSLKSLKETINNPERDNKIIRHIILTLLFEVRRTGILQHDMEDSIKHFLEENKISQKEFQKFKKERFQRFKNNYHMENSIKLFLKEHFEEHFSKEEENGISWKEFQKFKKEGYKYLKKT